MRSWSLAIFLTLAIISPLGCLGWLVYNGQNIQQVQNGSVEFQQTVLQEGMEVPIGAINVLNGHKFEVAIDQNRWIIIRLPSMTKTGSVEKVKEILQTNQGANPSVKLLREFDDYWVADIYINTPNKTSLLDVVRRKNLLLVNE